eukprot:Hpha_TRINITY_DN6489_c0_g2::TRINITY_DN6489_c0_g2_i1::g.249::m.249
MVVAEVVLSHACDAAGLFLGHGDLRMHLPVWLLGDREEEYSRGDDNCLAEGAQGRIVCVGEQNGHQVVQVAGAGGSVSTFWAQDLRGRESDAKNSTLSLPMPLLKRRGRTKPLGIQLSEEMKVTEVDERSPAALVGVSRFIGCRVVLVGGEACGSEDDLKAATEAGKDVLLVGLQWPISAPEDRLEIEKEVGEGLGVHMEAMR